ncbi:protein-disulfide reductase DsbD family protein [Flavobacterium hibernum]|uniref:Thiol:disulfide interchange protein n=1 Tax=Flavobacterium hibernum TaxID=37752 RepID=A0A0D0END7_9FLAO|nr:thioredoxin family protein [Flavobacterium hibernum]KIO54495.1 thiol:disulfide interchange protein DsbD [Flavobacterium hibernum]OXA84518.1 thiol:disulfide interchange protein [Flavobacterium hibernum]STO10237.1 Thiol:disulfide interchange protein DsbD precursor [Flavobacterium hibernum]
MKNSITTLLLLLSCSMFGQMYNPVKWSTSVEKISDKEYVLKAEAVIQSGWHLYGQYIEEGGPSATAFTFKNPKKNFELNGKTTEGKGHEVVDKIFNMKIKYFEDKALFTQKIKFTSDQITNIAAEVEFMVCDDSNCLPPSSEELTFKIPNSKKVASAEETAATKDSAIVDEKATIEKVEKEEKTVSSPAKKKDSRGLISIFIIAFLSGFAALLTPCVFPMIPMTVSYFTKQSKTKAAGIRNALIYGFSIIIIYVLLGSIVTAVFGADSLNALSTNVWFNLIFFVLLVVFAVSFLGAFEIMLPNALANKVDSQADRGGLIGIFFMALALAIVSFSCTGPIVGTLLVEAASKGGIAPIVGMLGFSTAIALPFSLFAAFPGWLNALPKSGGWLNTVKVVLGFLELALAFKFLSNADLVLQLHWLEREVFLTIWIAVFGTLAFYLFGKITLPHDSPLNHISVGRLSFGLIVLSFTIYLIPGLWGAPLKLISGFAPPMQYSESPEGFGGSKSSGETKSVLPDGAEFGPQNIITFHDYQKGMEFAKKNGKPVLLDFTGYACVNCRKMEELVWSDAKVLNVLKNNVVLISLYVDDKKELPENEQYVSETTGKKIKTIGNKWSDLQIKTYKANAQPYYVIVDHNSANLVEPSAYNPDIEDYYNWLNSGIQKFKK